MQDREPYIISEKRTVRRIYWGRIVAVTVVLSLLGMGATIWYARTCAQLITQSRKYWFVSMGEYTELGEAAERAATVSRAGGAGYIYGESEYKVAACCYASESDAVAVSTRLSESGENSDVFYIECPALRIDKPKRDSSRLKSLLEKPGEIFDGLYDLSVKLDTKEISESAALYAVLKLCDEIRVCSQSASEAGGEAGEFLSGVFDAVGDSLGSLAGAASDVPAKLRYALCETAVTICEKFANL